MAVSKLSTEVVAFGRKLVDELGLGQSVDTPGRWMCHYLAEVMTRAEAAEGAERKVAEQECFMTILQLWKHRGSMPSDRRPLVSFDPIFRVLERLHDQAHFMYFEPADGPPESKGAGWLDLAAKMDRAVRDLIRWCIVHATVEAAAKDGTWAEDSTAQSLDDGPDLTAARLLLGNMHVLLGTKEQLAERRAKELVDMRTRLDEFVKASKTMRESIQLALSKRPRIVRRRKAIKRRTSRR